ncbi:hypothetical protein [Nocardia tengchongensis]|uniref:hypothetical protein n=1 Tax=Nocardia tengchongensis TaxID=2055889 RepID=UPI00369C6CF7
MSDNTIHAMDALSAVDLLANDILADPEIASHHPDPAVVIVELAARARHLRTRLGVVTSNWYTASEQLTAMRAECRNLTADRDRAQDAALWYAAKLGITGHPALEA